MRTNSEEVDHWLEQANNDIDNNYVLAAMVSLSVAVKHLHQMVKDNNGRNDHFNDTNEDIRS